MLDLKMKDICRICGRELCGNQRRWIFHTTAKLNLQVILCHVLGKEISRDGHPEFSCSKCAFMLERFFRFDTVIARIEALSIERLQKLISEKDRLKHCLTSLYRKNNNDDGEESKSGHGTTDSSNLSDVQYSYSALLQADFAYSGFEYWTELDEYNQGPQSCPHTEGTGGVPRKCHCCSFLRVADSDYEAVCKVPRKLTQNLPYGHLSTCTSTFSEQMVHQTSHGEAANINTLDKEGVDKLCSEYSPEYLSRNKDPPSNMQKPEEKIKLSTENTICNCLSSNMSCGNKLDVALSLVKMLDYRPVQSPKGSKIPIKSSILKPHAILTSGELSSSNTIIGFLENIVESPSKLSEDSSSELTDLQSLWQNIYEDYIPLYTQNLNKQNQDANQYDALLGQQISKLRNAEQEIQVLQKKIHESEDTIKMLQDTQQQLAAKLRAAKELTNNQEVVMQSLRETLQSKDQEVAELYQIIGDHNNTISKLQDMLLKSRNEHLQVMPTQLELLDLQNSLLSTQMELQKKQMALRQKEYQLTDAKRSQQVLEVHLLEGQQEKETTWKHNQELHEALHKIQQELQEKSQHLKNVEDENSTKLAAQEHSIQRLKEIVSKREQMIHEYVDALKYNQSLETINGSNGHMLEKLRQRIQDRDAALEQAVDGKFRALEEKEKEVHQLKRIIREREQDTERLSNVLSGNEETINSLDNLVKSKDFELEQISAAYKNMQWLKQETEAKYRLSLSEKETVIMQLQDSLQERSKEIETYTHSATPVCMKNLDANGKECEKTNILKGDLDKAQEDLNLVLRKMREYQLEVSALQSIIMKQNEQLRDQVADIDTLTRNIQIKEDLIKDLQINLVDREDIPTLELLIQQIFSLKEKMSSIDCVSHKQLGHTQEVLKLLEELIVNKTRLGEVLHTERQLYSCLMKCSTDCESFSVSSKLLNELLTAQALRGQLEDTIMRKIEELVDMQSENKAATGFGDPHGNKNIEKNKDLLRESSKIHNDTNPFRVHIQKITNEHHHLAEENILEELQEAEIRSPNIRNMQRDVCIQKKNLKVAEEKGMLGQLHYMREKKVQEGRSVDFRIIKEERPQEEVTNKCLAEQRNRNGILNSSLRKRSAYESETKIQTSAGIRGPQKTGSLKRSCHSSSPLDEDKSKIPKTGKESFEMLHKSLDTSCLQTDNNMDKYVMQLQFKPKNPGMQDLSAAHHAAMHRNTHFGKEYDCFLNESLLKCNGFQAECQDLGYETCGRSEYEIDREEATSPEYEKDDDVFTKASSWPDVASSIPLRNTEEPNWNIDVMKSEDVAMLCQLVKTLKAQLQQSHHHIQALQSQGSSSHASCSLTDEDEGWHSDATGPRSPRLIENLAQRVSVLEMHIYQLQKDTGHQCHISLVKESGKYDWLIQAQARELSLMRQAMEDGQNSCRMLTQHLEETIKAFEEMLRANDIDYYMGKSFRERLTRGKQLAVRLHRTLSSRVCFEINKNTGSEFQQSRIAKNICQNERKLESVQPDVKDGLISSAGSHASCPSDGTPSLLDDELSASEELDNSSDVSIESGYPSRHNGDNHKDQPHSVDIERSHTLEDGLYIIGHAEDFRALKKHVTNSNALAGELETYLKVMEYGDIKKAISTTRILLSILGESQSLLNMFWTDSMLNMPTNAVQNKEEQAMKNEIVTLRNKLEEKERTLKKASDQMKMSALAKQIMERCISRQLSNTCEILKKARSNMQMRQQSTLIIL